jgi:hypothetical protein
MNTLFSSIYNKLMYPETERKQVSLRVFNNEPIARVAEQCLQMEGIPCLVRSLQGGPGLWGTAYNSPHDLLVYEENEARAREVLLILPREEPEPCQESEEESSLMPPWMVTVTIVAIVALISFGMAIANR